MTTAPDPSRPAATDIVRAAAGGTAVGLAWSAAGLVTWTFAGYPLFAWATATVRPRPVAIDRAHTPTVSVVIPAFNEAGVIVDKVASVLAADYPAGRCEVLVVDDGSSDGTAELVAQSGYRDVRVLRQPQRTGKAAAVNRGVAAASGDIIVLSDASALFDEAALRRAVPLFADPQIGVVVGSIRVLDEQSGVARPAGLYWRLQQRLAQWESRTGSTVGVNGNFFAFRRETFAPLAPDIINDEFTMAMRHAAAGRRVVAGEGVATFDRASASMTAEYGRRARITAGRLQWATSAEGRRHPLLFRLASHKLSRAAVPPAFVVLLAATVGRALLAGRPDRDARPSDLIALRGTGAWAWVGAQVLFWGAGAAGIAIERRTGGRVPGALRIPAFLASTTVAGLAGLSRHLTRRQSVLWTTASPHATGTGTQPHDAPPVRPLL